MGHDADHGPQSQCNRVAVALPRSQRPPVGVGSRYTSALARRRPEAFVSLAHTAEGDGLHLPAGDMDHDKLKKLSKSTLRVPAEYRPAPTKSEIALANQVPDPPPAFASGASSPNTGTQWTGDFRQALSAGPAWAVSIPVVGEVSARATSNSIFRRRTRAARATGAVCPTSSICSTEAPCCRPKRNQAHARLAQGTRGTPEGPRPPSGLRVTNGTHNGWRTTACTHAGEEVCHSSAEVRRAECIWPADAESEDVRRDDQGALVLRAG